MDNRKQRIDDKIQFPLVFKGAQPWSKADIPSPILCKFKPTWQQTWFWLISHYLLSLLKKLKHLLDGYHILSPLLNFIECLFSTMLINIKAAKSKWYHHIRCGHSLIETVHETRSSSFTEVLLSAPVLGVIVCPWSIIKEK